MKRNPGRSKLRGVFLILLFVSGAALFAGCQPNTEPTEEAVAQFVPPTANPAQTLVPNPTPQPLPTRQVNCQNQLKFVDDLTVPDGSEYLPGEQITKRWLIKNDGSCNWDQYYSLQLISGLALGADKTQALFPARQSTRAVLEITFYAPDNPGRYNSWWQAYDPEGNRFGDPVYMEIAVVEELSEEVEDGDEEASQ